MLDEEEETNNDTLNEHWLTSLFYLLYKLVFKSQEWNKLIVLDKIAWEQCLKVEYLSLYPSYSTVSMIFLLFLF